MRTAQWTLLLTAAAGTALALMRSSMARPSEGSRGLLRWQQSFTDINTADADELKKLGLDGVAVDRIVENRPYRHKLELVSRMVLPKKIYGTIRHHIGVRNPAGGMKKLA